MGQTCAPRSARRALTTESCRSDQEGGVEGEESGGTTVGRLRAGWAGAGLNQGRVAVEDRNGAAGEGCQRGVGPYGHTLDRCRRCGGRRPAAGRRRGGEVIAGAWGLSTAAAAAVRRGCLQWLQRGRQGHAQDHQQNTDVPYHLHSQVIIRTQPSPRQADRHPEPSPAVYPGGRRW